MWRENTGDNQYDEFTKRVGYWATLRSINMQKIDPSTLEEANKKIKTYSDQMPDKTSTFQVIGLDSKTYSIDCWYKNYSKSVLF